MNVNLKSRFSNTCFSLFSRNSNNPAGSSKAKDSAVIEMEEEPYDDDQQHGDRHHLLYKYVLIYGGGTSLGTKCVYEFKMQNWWVCSIDAIANTHADVNIMISLDDTACKQEHDIIISLKSILNDKKLDMIICTSGLGAHVLLQEEDFVKVTMETWKDNVQSAIICSKIAYKYLKPSGVFVITSDSSALKPNPSKIGNDVCKSALIHLTKCLACPESGLPKSSIILGLLPTRLDTADARVRSPEADAGTFTPLQYVSDLFIRWGRRKNLPACGSLCLLTTNNFNTDLSFQR